VTFQLPGFKKSLIFLFFSFSVFPLNSSEEQNKLYPVFDLHCDTLYQNLKNPLDIKQNSGSIDIEKMKKGGYMAQVFAIWVPPGKGWGTVESMASAFYKWKEQYPDEIALALTGTQILKARQLGQIAGVLGIEGLSSLSGDESKVDLLYHYGIRILGLTWFDSNEFAGSSNSKDKRGNYGLTEKGIRLVKMANNLGMVIDVSHASDQTVRDVAKFSNDPFIASHSCSRVLMDIERNLSDEMIKIISQKGGVVGVNFHRGFLSSKPRNMISLLDVVEHIVHIVKVAGIDHVALGSDFDGSSPPQDLDNAEKIQSLAVQLLKRGFSEMDVKKIMGLNALRVFTAVTEKKKTEKILSHIGGIIPTPSISSHPLLF